MPDLSSETIHATCVAIDGRGVLIEGRSGAGKSDLALRLIDRGAELVSDDYTVTMRRGARLVAAAPATIAGRMEVRGLGIIDMAHRSEAEVALVVIIEESPERLPLQPVTRRIAGFGVPAVALAALEPSAPIKVEMALRRFGGAA